MAETPHGIIWRLEKECIALRERAERAEAKLRRERAKKAAGADLGHLRT